MSPPLSSTSTLALPCICWLLHAANNFTRAEAHTSISGCVSQVFNTSASKPGYRLASEWFQPSERNIV